MKTLIGEEASAVGLTMVEVQRIYDKAYSAATPEKPCIARSYTYGSAISFQHRL